MQFLQMKSDGRRLQNPDNVQAAAGNPAADGEEYEYEYIELAEGEELPEDAEYEYVEVSDDEMPSMIPPTAVVSTSDVSEPEVSTPEPIISSAPETVAEPASSAPVQSVDAVVPQAPFHNRYRFRRWRKQI